MKRKKRQSGQAVLEFLLVFMILMMMIFVVVQMAWGLAFGHYAHYATYMAARAYMSAGPTKQDQADRAGQVLSSMLKTNGGQADVFPFIQRARTGDARDISGGPEEVSGAFIGLHPQAIGHEGSRFFSWAEGVQYNFEVPLYFLPISSFIGKDKGKNIEIGSATDSVKSVEWQGGIPFTSDAWLGREVSTEECRQDMDRLSHSAIGRQDGALFIEDNGC